MREHFIQIQPISFIEYIIVDDPDKGLIKLTTSTAMLEYLEYNQNNPNDEYKAYAYVTLGQVYYSGLLKRPQNYEIAFSMFTRSLNLSKSIGDISIKKQSAIMLAVMYINGEGIAINEKQAQKYVHIANNSFEE